MEKRHQCEHENNILPNVWTPPCVASFTHSYLCNHPPKCVCMNKSEERVFDSFDFKNRKVSAKKITISVIRTYIIQWKFIQIAVGNPHTNLSLSPFHPHSFTDGKLNSPAFLMVDLDFASLNWLLRFHYLQYGLLFRYANTIYSGLAAIRVLRFASLP